MKITLTSHSCNHLLRLSQGLQSQGILNKFFTIYPQFKLRDYHIQKQHIHAIRSLGAAVFVLRKAGRNIPDKMLSTLFDNYVATTLRFDRSQPTVVQGNSGYCLKTIRSAKRRGIKTVVDRACPHIDFQLTLLDEEVERLTGAKKQVSATHTLREKMLAEYDEADSIIVPSKYTYQSFKQKGFDDNKLKIVPLMKEKNVVPAVNIAKDNTQPFTVLAVGFSFYRKGFYYLLKAWHELNLPHAKLVVRNVVPKEFHQLLQHKSIVAIDAHLSVDQLVKHYQQCDVFCLPSVDEGFGMAAVEAMAARKPVIVTENVGMADIITDKKEGFILPIRNVDAIKESILALYDDRDLAQQMGEAAYFCEQRYSLDRYIETIVKVYSSLG